MFACTDKVEVFSFDFVHHGVHFIKTHNACYNVASYHKRRNAVCEASVYHKVSGIRNNRRMKSRDVSHEIVETVSGYLSGAVKIYAVKAFHNVRMVRNLKIGNNRFAVFLHFHIFAVIFSYGNRRVDYVGNSHHDFFDFFLNFFFFLCKFIYSGRIFCNFGFYPLGFFLFTLCHKTADLF